MAVAGDVLFFVSEPVLAEYEEVLRRPRFAIERDKLSNAIARIRSASLLVHPETRVTAALDPDDNIFLECAQAADADYLITGNIKHFPATWRKTQIVTPRQFLEAAGFQEKIFVS